MNLPLGPIVGHFSSLEELFDKFLRTHLVVGGLFINADTVPDLLVLQGDAPDDFYLMQNTAHPRRCVFLPQDVWSCDASVLSHPFFALMKKPEPVIAVV